MSKHLPSAQARRGDHDLKSARDLRDEWKGVIPHNDMSTIQNRIIMTSDMRVGLDSKKGIPKIVHARAYRRYAEETLHVVETLSDRARDAEVFGSSQHTPDEQLQRTIDMAEATYRCYLSCKGLFPTAEQETIWEKAVWPVACSKTGTRANRPDDLSEKLSTVGSRFRADVKAKITPLVARFYKFETGGAIATLKQNAERAQDLKTDLAFINGENGLPYRHSIIQQAINDIWFGGHRSEGIMFSNEFSPMPYEAIALVITVIDCCLDEWSKGCWVEVQFTYEHYQELYAHHLATLRALTDQGLNTRHCDPLYQLRRDLYEEGRKHAGVMLRVLPDGLQVWPQDRVDAACEGVKGV